MAFFAMTRRNGRVGLILLLAGLSLGAAFQRFPSSSLKPVKRGFGAPRLASASPKELDTDALVKYGAALGIQVCT